MLEAVLAGVVALALVGGVFWMAFGNPPERHKDGGLSQHDASNYRGDSDGGPAL